MKHDDDFEAAVAELDAALVREFPIEKFKKRPRSVNDTDIFWNAAFVLNQ